MFHVRSIYPGTERIEEGTFELQPTNPQGEAVCKLFSEFLSGRPPQFRDKLSFLKKGDFAIDWSAAPGGVALVSLLQSGAPAALGVLVSGLQKDTDAMMLEVFHENVLAPLFEDSYDHAITIPDRPMLLQVMFADPEWVPALRLLGASLASVYFRSVMQAAEDSASAGASFHSPT